MSCDPTHLGPALKAVGVPAGQLKAGAQNGVASALARAADPAALRAQAFERLAAGRVQENAAIEARNAARERGFPESPARLLDPAELETRYADFVTTVRRREVDDSYEEAAGGQSPDYYGDVRERIDLCAEDVLVRLFDDAGLPRPTGDTGGPLDFAERAAFYWLGRDYRIVNLVARAYARQAGLAEIVRQIGPRLPADLQTAEALEASFMAPLPAEESPDGWRGVKADDFAGLLYDLQIPQATAFFFDSTAFFDDPDDERRYARLLDLLEQDKSELLIDVRSPVDGRSPRAAAQPALFRGLRLAEAGDFDGVLALAARLDPYAECCTLHSAAERAAEQGRPEASRRLYAESLSRTEARVGGEARLFQLERLFVVGYGRDGILNDIPADIRGRAADLWLATALTVGTGVRGHFREIMKALPFERLWPVVERLPLVDDQTPDILREFEDDGLPAAYAQKLGDRLVREWPAEVDYSTRRLLKELVTRLGPRLTPDQRTTLAAKVWETFADKWADYDRAQALKALAPANEKES